MHPTDSDRMHCVVFVISAMNVTAMHPDMVKKFKDIRNEARERGADFSVMTMTLLMFVRTSSHYHPDTG